jgi:transposase InsO family protein
MRVVPGKVCADRLWMGDDELRFAALDEKAQGEDDSVGGRRLRHQPGIRERVVVSPIPPSVEREIKISMDGKGRWMGNVFIERLWRSLKYECVYLHEGIGETTTLSYRQPDRNASVPRPVAPSALSHHV